MGKLENWVIKEIKEIRWVVGEENENENENGKGEQLKRVELVEKGENDEKWMVVGIKEEENEEKENEEKEKGSS